MFVTGLDISGVDGVNNETEEAACDSMLWLWSSVVQLHQCSWVQRPPPPMMTMPTMMTSAHREQQQKVIVERRVIRL